MPDRYEPQARRSGVAGDEREMPHNEEAEQALLAALLHSNKSFDAVVDFVRPEHFYLPVHGRIYEAIGKLIDRGEKANPVALVNFFEHDEDLVEVGAKQYLAGLSRNVITTANNAHYGALIVDLYKRRELIALAREIADAASLPSIDETADAIAKGAEQTLFDILDPGSKSGGAISMGDSARAALAQSEHAYKNHGRLIGLPTGITALDNKLGGLKPKLFYVLGARPSMGKTALADTAGKAAAVALAAEAAKVGKKPKIVLSFALEGTHEELSHRRLAAETYTDLTSLQRGQLSNAKWGDLNEAVQRFDEIPFWTDDQPGLTVSDVRQRARRLHRIGSGVGLIIVDHIQKMAGSLEAMRRGETSVVTEISDGLQKLAKELGCPVLALSQPGRELERRDDKRPMLSDLRQSGAIEQDADVVMFLYRDEYYAERSEPVQKDGEDVERFGERYSRWEERVARGKNRADVIVAKQRNGPIGTVPVRVDMSMAIMTNMPDPEEIPF